MTATPAPLLDEDCPTTFSMVTARLLVRPEPRPPREERRRSATPDATSAMVSRSAPPAAANRTRLPLALSAVAACALAALFTSAGDEGDGRESSLPVSGGDGGGTDGGGGDGGGGDGGGANGGGGNGDGGNGGGGEGGGDEGGNGTSTSGTSGGVAGA